MTRNYASFIKDLSIKRKWPFLRALGKRVGVALLSLALLLTALASVSPQLHELLHADGKGGHDLPFDQHQCAVTLLAQGSIEAASPVLFASACVWTEFDVHLPVQNSAPATADYRWARERAPPFFGFPS